MFLKRTIIVLSLLLLPAVLQAQVVEEAIEQWMAEEGDENAAAEMYDQLQQLRLEPLNLNDTAALDRLPMLDYFQRRALKSYIVLYGQLLSKKELLLIPGFDSAVVQQIDPFVTVAPVDDKGGFKPWHGRHSLVAGLGGSVEHAAGYGNGHYAGDDVRALLCYNYNYRNRVSFRFAADKDATEEWGRGNYYSYHLMLNDVWRIERLIVGRYNLQFGQGLTLWTGMTPFSILGASTMRYGSGVRPAGTFYESNHQEGVAATVDLGRDVYFSGFVSREEGESLYGSHVELRKPNLVVGATVAYTKLDDSVTLRDYVYNAGYFRGDRMLNGGVDAAWQWQRLTLYGEVSADQDGHLAALAGADISASADNKFGVSYRRYDTAYHNLHAGGYAIGNMQAESGLSLYAATALPLHIKALASLDVHRFSSLRYGSYTPSSGAWLRVQLSRQLWKNTSAMLRYAYRQKERNVPYDDTNIYVGEETLRQQLQGEVRMENGRWRVTAKGIAAWFDSENGVAQRGLVVAATARYSGKRLQATVGAAWFDVDGYYARIYVSESTLQYAWNMPSLTGHGVRTYLQLRYDVSHNVCVAARYAATFQPGEEAIGTGDSRTEGPLRQTWNIQLRWKF